MNKKTGVAIRWSGVRLEIGLSGSSFIVVPQSQFCSYHRSVVSPHTHERLLVYC